MEGGSLQLWLYIILYAFLNLVTEKTPGGMSGGISVCVRAVCQLTMQTIWDFQHIHVSYKKMK